MFKRIRNSVDFRGPEATPGAKGQYAEVALHAGLICLDASEGMDLNLQLELFEHALDELGTDGHLVNQVLEVSLEEGEDIRVLRYSLPSQ